MCPGKALLAKSESLTSHCFRYFYWGYMEKEGERVNFFISVSDPYSQEIGASIIQDSNQTVFRPTLPEPNGLFLKKDSPKPLKIALGSFRNFPKIRWEFASQSAPPVSTTPVVHLELHLRKFSTKIRNGPNGILMGLGKTDSLQLVPACAVLYTLTKHKISGVFLSYTAHTLTIC